MTFCVARNPRHRIVPGSIKDDLQAAVDNPNPTTRLGAVHELGDVATGGQLTEAAAARKALNRLTGDDSRRVSTAASNELERTAVRLDRTTVEFGQIEVGRQSTADIPVTGGPLAMASGVATSDRAVRAWPADHGLHVVWIPTRSGHLDATVTLSGPAGEAQVHVGGVAVDPNAPVPGPESPVVTPTAKPPSQQPSATTTANPRVGQQPTPPAQQPPPVAAPTPAAQSPIPTTPEVAIPGSPLSTGPAGRAAAHPPIVPPGQPPVPGPTSSWPTSGGRPAAAGGDRRYHRWLSSTWLLVPLLSIGFLTWAAFLFIGARTQTRRWLVAAGAYAVATGLIITGFATSRPHAPAGAAVGLAVGGLFVVWIIGFAHAAAVNRTYLQKLEARGDPWRHR